MELFRVCIVEDSAAAREKLRAFLAVYEEEHDCRFSVSEFADPLDFLEKFRNNFDFIFLDIDLPYMDGMEIARRIRATDKQAIVIFVTNMVQYAVKGYEVEALDFIVKPVQYATFAMKLERAVGRFQAHRGKDIWICEENSRRRLRTLDIKYVEVSHHNVIYHTVEGDYKAYDQLKNVCASLADAPFALCNRCFLVNLHYVTAIGDYSVTVAGEELQISRSKKKDFLKSLNEYLGGK